MRWPWRAPPPPAAPRSVSARLPPSRSRRWSRANPQTFFQLYWAGSRDQIVSRIDRARAAGVRGLIVTLDWTFSHSRDWGSPKIPEKLDLLTMIKLLPEALTRPEWFMASGP